MNMAGITEVEVSHRMNVARAVRNITTLFNSVKDGTGEAHKRDTARPAFPLVGRR